LSDEPRDGCSHGRIGGHLPGWPGAKIALVDHRGAKSGIRRTDTTVQIGGEIRSVRARLATDAERARLWPAFLAFYPGYAFFREHAKPRVLPIVMLEPCAPR
jgi:hypothetical protein